MPRIFEWNGYKFYFFSNEGIPREPRHVHVRKGEFVAKFWLEPETSLASSWGMSSKELNDLEKKVDENRKMIMEKWDEYFNG